MKFPLMRNNVTRQDLDAMIEHLKQDDPILTNGPKCKEFEEAWSKWLGVKYSVFVNSGASANLLSMTMLKIKYPQGGEVIAQKPVAGSRVRFGTAVVLTIRSIDRTELYKTTARPRLAGSEALIFLALVAGALLALRMLVF